MKNSESVGGIQIERKSSIESEPKTLNIDQMHFAREAALFVLNTRSIEEALTIFTEGLEPVTMSVATTQKGSEDHIINMLDSDEEEMSDFIADEIQLLHPDLPPAGLIRDAVSAPF